MTVNSIDLSCGQFKQDVEDMVMGFWEHYLNLCDISLIVKINHQINQ